MRTRKLSRPTRERRSVRLRGAVQGLPILFVAGCQAVPLDRAGSLTSYANLQPADGLVTKALVRVDAGDVRAARTVRLVPTTFSAAAARAALSDTQRKLVANTIDRALCLGLSERFAVVTTPNADLTVQVVVSRIEVTDEAAAGVSKAASIVPSIIGIPVPVPRLPIGLGSLSIEAEARDLRGAQKAAMLWGRGASAFGSSVTVSPAGDAYALAGEFGEDFSALLVTGESPFGRMPSLPSADKIGAAVGAAPKQAACEAFGRGPGVRGMVAARIGLPPEWTDDGAAKDAPGKAP